MASGITTSDNQVNDRVKIQSEFLYDARTSGYDAGFFHTISGVPTAGADGITLTSSSTVTKANFMFGKVKFYLDIVDAPAAGQNKTWGFSSQTASDLSQGALFIITGAVFKVVVGANGSFSEFESPWDPSWTNATTPFTIDWTNDYIRFSAGFDNVLINEFRFDRGDPMPDQPLGCMFREYGADVMIINQLVMFIHSAFVTIGAGSSVGVLPLGIVYGSPDDGVTAIAMPVQAENATAPNDMVMVGGATGPTGVGSLAKPLNLHTGNGMVGSWGALNTYNSEHGFLLDDATTGWTGSATVTGITANNFGISFDKTGVGSATAEISKSTLNVNIDHLVYGKWSTRFFVPTSNVATIVVKIGTSAADYGLWQFNPGIVASGKMEELSGDLYQPDTIVGTWGPQAGVNYISIQVNMNAVGDLFNNATFGPFWMYSGVAQKDYDPVMLRSRWVDLDAAPGSIAVAYTSCLNEPVYVGDMQEIDLHFLYTKGAETTAQIVFSFAQTATGPTCNPTLSVVAGGLITHAIEQHSLSASGDYIISVPVRGDYVDIFQGSTGLPATGTYRGQIYLQNRGRSNVN